MTDYSAAIRDTWDFGDPAASEARFAAMLAEAEGLRDQTFAMLLRTQIARAQGLQRRFDEAHAMLNDVDLWTHTRSIQDPRVDMQANLERGRLFNSAGRASEAVQHFRFALHHCSDPHVAPHLDALAVDAAHMLAIVDSANADEWNRKALDLAESSLDPTARRWRGSLLNNMGWAAFARGDHAIALELFERALAARVEQGITGKGRGPWLIARWCVAKAHRALGQTGRALEEQHGLAAEHAAAGTRDGFVEEEIGECLLALGRAEESRGHFAAAYAELAKDAWLVEREAERIERLRTLAG